MREDKTRLEIIRYQHPASAMRLTLNTAESMNIIPLIPAGRCTRMRPPATKAVAQERKAISGFVKCSRSASSAKPMPAAFRPSIAVAGLHWSLQNMRKSD